MCFKSNHHNEGGASNFKGPGGGAFNYQDHGGDRVKILVSV